MIHSKKKKLKGLSAVRGASDSCDQAEGNPTARGARERSNKEIHQRFRFLVGVDEAGRGPLAGPVAVGVVVVPHDFDWALIPGVKDSKKVAPKKREAIYGMARALKRKQVINYAVSLVSAAKIDQMGITRAVTLAIERCFLKLALDPTHTQVKLDGLLKAPQRFFIQETIIKGDAKEKVIGLASILAKATRDRTMVRHSRQFPQYKFEAHKGYGTDMHYDAIYEHGLSVLHRKSFCRKIQLILEENTHASYAPQGLRRI